MPNKKQHLSYEERFCIEKMSKADISLKTISKALGRGLSTINQEIKQNGGKKSYNALNAQNERNNKQHNKKHKYNKVFGDENLKTFVDYHLKRGQSPEAISFLLEKQETLGYASSKSIRKYIKQILK